jgi:hypothetical protein
MQLNRGVYWHGIRTSLADWAGVPCRVGRPSWYCTAGGLTLEAWLFQAHIHLSYQLDEMLLKFLFLSPCNEPPNTFFKMKLWRLPKTEASTMKYRVPSLWPTYVGERRTTFAKAYGIKVRCYGEHFGNWWTYWEPGNLFLKSFPHPQLKRKKKQGTLSACLGLPIGYMKFVFPKEFVTIFGLG